MRGCAFFRCSLFCIEIYLILTLVLGAICFGSRKIKKGGISPILLICLSALAGIATYGFGSIGY